MSDRRFYSSGERKSDRHGSNIEGCRDPDTTLNFGFGLQLHLSIEHLYRVLHRLTSVLLPDLLSLLLHECGKALCRARDALPRLFLGRGERFIQLLHPLPLAPGVGTLRTEGFVFRRGDRRHGRSTYSIDLVFRLALFGSQTLNREQGVLRPSIAFFTNAALFSP